MNVEQAIERLHSQLPLRTRQEALPPELVKVHRGILRAFIDKGRPLNSAEIASMIPDGDSENLTVFDLDEAVSFGAGFFKPLI